MNTIVRSLALVLFAAAPVVAVAQAHGGNAWRPSDAGVQGGNNWKPTSGATQGGNAWRPGNAGTLSRAGGSCGVTDMPEFSAFIDGKPTPAEFRAAYSCVALILPGDVTTREMRSDNSRYFADLDVHGRIVGGHFQ